MKPRMRVASFTWKLDDTKTYKFRMIRNKVMLQYYCNSCSQRHSAFVCKMITPFLVLRTLVRDGKAHLFVNGTLKKVLQVRDHPPDCEITHSQSFCDIKEILVNNTKDIVVITLPPSICYMSDFLISHLTNYRCIVTNTLVREYFHLPHILAMSFAFSKP